MKKHGNVLNFMQEIRIQQRNIGKVVIYGTDFLIVLKDVKKKAKNYLKKQLMKEILMLNYVMLLLLNKFLIKKKINKYLWNILKELLMKEIIPLHNLTWVIYILKENVMFQRT